MNNKEGWQDVDQILGLKLKLKRSFWWVPYDPDGFISARKVKYRFTTYEHCKIPQIEQFSNQDEWVEGTLVEEFTEEEKMEQAMKNLEKLLTWTLLDRSHLNCLNTLERAHQLLQLHNKLPNKILLLQAYPKAKK